MLEEIPKTLLEATAYFAVPAHCNDFMRELKWPSGVIVCPRCGNASCSEIASRPGTIKCNRAACQKQFSTKVGTIFEDSPLPLNKWFVAVWAIANCRNGISSHELGRAICVTQKTAWSMTRKIKLALAWGTSLENHADKRTHGTIAKGERHGKVKLNQDQIDSLLALKGTITQQSAADQFGVSRGYVGQLWSGNRQRVPA